MIIVAKTNMIVMIVAIAGGHAMEGEAAYALSVSQENIAIGAHGGGMDVNATGGGVTRRSTITEVSIATPKSKLLQ